MIIGDFSDAYCGQERPSRNLIWCYFLITENHLLNWSSKQQSFVSQTEKESEFISLAVCLKEVLWKKKLARFFKGILLAAVVKSIFYISIGEDNMDRIKDGQALTVSHISLILNKKFELIMSLKERWVSTFWI